METNEIKLKTSVYFVEATHNEQFNLWKEYKDIWKDDLQGFTEIVGRIENNKDMPVNVAFSFAWINGQRVCFFDPVSRFVDHEMIKSYIKDYNDKIIDAANFHITVQHIEKLKNELNKTV